LTLFGSKLSTLTVWSIAGLSVTVAIFMNFAPLLPHVVVAPGIEGSGISSSLLPSTDIVEAP
jgi:hypothetical protein